MFLGENGLLKTDSLEADILSSAMAAALLAVLVQGPAAAVWRAGLSTFLASDVARNLRNV